MRKAIRVAGVAGLLAAGAMAAAWGLSRDSRAETKPSGGSAPGADVVMLRCTVAGADLAVTAFQGSTAAPAKKSGNCAESLSLLMKDGFAIRDTGHYVEEKLGFLVVTLVR